MFEIVTAHILSYLLTGLYVGNQRYRTFQELYQHMIEDVNRIKSHKSHSNLEYTLMQTALEKAIERKQDMEKLMRLKQARRIVISTYLMRWPAMIINEAKGVK